MIADKVRNHLKPVLGFIASPLIKADIHPNFITGTGLLLTSIGAMFLALGDYLISFIFMVLGGFCDMLDGAVARTTGKIGEYGAFLDSTFDRYGETVVHIALMVLFLRETTGLTFPILIMLSLSGSLMVSYVKARAEGLGKSCTTGFMQRPERVILILLSTLFAIFYGLISLKIMLWLMVVTVHLTTLQRIVALAKQCHPDKK